MSVTQFATLVRLEPPAVNPSFDALRSRRAIDFALAGRVLTRNWFCHYCGFVPSGATDNAVRAAIEDHWGHVNAHADIATDPHFEDARIEALLADQPFTLTRLPAPVEG